MLLALALSMLVSANPVEEARANLKAGKLDDVLFALDGKKLADADKPKAAQVLGDASKAAWEKQDATLALQFSQMALKLEPNQTQALEAGSHAAFSQQQFEIADSYAERWLKAEPGSGEAHVYRAELANEAGEWQRALDALEGAKLDPAQQKRADGVRAKAESELAAQKQGRSELNTLEREMAKAQDKAAKDQQGVPPMPPNPMATPPRTDQVIIYTKTHDPELTREMAFFAARKVMPQVKYIDGDGVAMAELMAKAVNQGLSPNTTPVIDVHGKLIVGWNPAEIESALKRH